MPKRSRRSRRRVTLFSRFRRELRTLSLADRCLFFMFLVLLVQSAAVMFSPPLDAGGEIDIIVRTSSASIFGYLLSGGLSGSRTIPESPAEDPAAMPVMPSPEPSAAAEPVSMEPVRTESGSASLPDMTQPAAGGCSRIRVLATAGVGIFCLLSLLLLRDWPGKAAQLADSGSGTAMVTQFRDFISGAVGFLTGCASRGSGTTPD